MPSRVLSAIFTWCTLSLLFTLTVFAREVSFISVEVGGVHIGVTDKKTFQLERLENISKENSSSKLTASASSKNILQIAFTINQVGDSKSTPPKIFPHQTFLKFVHKRDKTDVIYVAARPKTTASHYYAAISLAEESDSFSYRSGRYKVSILVGDKVIAKPIEWLIGEVELTFPEKPVKEYSLYKRSLLHTSDNTLNALPEITHRMRPPAERAGLATIVASSSAVIFALAAFLWFFIFRLRPNLNRLKSTSSKLFVTTLGAFVALYVGYWFALPGFSFYETIRYICFLVPVIIIVGRSSLASVVEVREAEEATAIKKVE